MTKPVKLEIISRFDPKGAREAVRTFGELARAQQAASRARSGMGADAGLERMGRDAAKAQREMLALTQAQGQAALSAQRLATEEQRTATATIQAATAAQRLAVEEQRVATATAQAATAAARAEQATLRLAQAKERAGDSKGLTALPRTIDGISGAAGRAVMALGGIGTAMAVISKGAELAQLGAQAGLVKTRFDGLAESAGTTGQALITALRSASGGEISDLNLRLAANKAQLLEVADSAEEFSTLMAVARDRAQQMGISTSQAFNDLVTGLGRGSALILDNLGITVSVTEANETYAASLGKTVSQLTEAEQKQALINAVLAQGRTSLEATGGAVRSAAGDFEALRAAGDNAQVAVGTLIAKLSQIPTRVTTEILVAVTGDIAAFNELPEKTAVVGQQILEQAQSYDEYRAKVGIAADAIKSINPLLGEAADFYAQNIQGIRPLTEAQFEYAQSLMVQGQSGEQALAQAQKLVDTFSVIEGVQQAAAQSGDVNAQAMDRLTGSMLTVASSVPGGAAAVEALATAFYNGQISAEIFQFNLDSMVAAHERNTDATARSIAQTAMLTQEHVTGSSAIADATTKSLIDAAAKEEEAAKTELLTLQTAAAADAFLALHPNISASGVAAMAAAGQIDPLLAQLIQARIRADEARGALALFNAQAGIRARAMADYRAGERTGGAATTASQERAQNQLLAQRARVEQQIADLHKTDAQRLADLRSQRAQLAPYDERRVAVEREILALQNKKPPGGAGGARGGGGAGKARISEAQKAGESLANIERDTGQKLAAIDQQTQAKLLEIDQKYAAQRAQAARKLNEDIALSNADMNAAMEANDLELVGASEENAARLAAREQAEAQARIRNEQAVAEARAMAAAGDAETAQDVLDIRQEAIAKQQQLDQAYAEKQAELAGNPEALAALKVQYDEATAAAAQAEQVRVDLALQAAEQRKSAQEAEKAKVIADAQEQKDKVVAAAVDQAARVKGASEAQQRAVYESLTAQANAASSWASSVESASGRVIDAANAAASAINSIPTMPSGGGGPTASPPPAGGAFAGGGSFVTTRPTLILVGDNPGGRERVSVTPLSGKGRTRVAPGSGLIAMAGGGEVTAGSDRTGRIATVSGGAGGSAALAFEEANRLIALAAEYAKAANANAKLLEKYSSAVADAVAPLKEIAELRQLLAVPQSPIDGAQVAALIAESRAVVEMMQAQLVPVSKEQNEALERYAKAVADATAPLKEIADLREALSNIAGPLLFDPDNLLDALGMPQGAATIEDLIEEIGRVLSAISAGLVPVSLEQADALERFAKAVSASIGPIKDIVDLRSAMASVGGRLLFDPTTLLDALGMPQGAVTINELAREIARVVAALQGALVPLTEEQTAAFSQYAGAVRDSVGVIKDIVDLRKTIAEEGIAPAIQPQTIMRLARDTEMIVRTIQGTLIPTTEDQSEGLGRYASAAGDSIGIVKDVIDLRTAIAESAVLPAISPTLVTRLATDARMVARIVRASLVPTTEDQTEGLSRYASAVRDSVGVVKDVLTLSGDMFADYHPPSDAQIRRIVSDARRVATQMAAAAATYEKDGLEAAQAFAEAVGGTFSAFREGLLFFDALRSGDFRLRSGDLAVFEESTRATLAVARRLGAEAATIPAANLAALERTTALLSAQAEALIRLAAVPFGDLPAAAANLNRFGGLFGGGGGGGGSTVNNFYTTVNPPPGADPNKIADMVVRRIEQKYRMRGAGR